MSLESPSPGVVDPNAAPVPDAERPNIVMIICDQLRADHLGFGGNPSVRTPHLDALAERGVVFENAHVANPTCMPNRASLMTGRWPSAHGTRCNGITLDPDHTTFVQQLADAGYSTAAVGKLHHQNMGWDFEDDQAEQIALTSPLLVDPGAPDANRPHREQGWDQWEDRQRHDAALVPLPAGYYGYDEVDLVIGHGDAPGGHWRWWASERGVDASLLGGHDAALRADATWNQIYTSAIPAHAHPTAFVGERAEARVRAAADAEEPFFLFMSFPDPHHPFAPPQEYADRYAPDALPLPLGFEQDHADSPAHIRAMAARRGQPDPDPTMAFSVTERQYRDAAAAQYGLIEFMDEQVGRVLRALEETGQAENTVVLFTADHGDLFGDHGLMLKHFVHYSAVTRVPLVVADPRRPERSGSREALVSSVDITATLLELGGATAIRGMHGRSLEPVLGGDAPIRERLLIEEDQPFSPEGLPAPTRIRTVITPRGRFTRYFGSSEAELYDHASDPGELANLALRPESAAFRSAMEVELLEAMAAVDDTGVAPTASA
ncbi:MAG: sulfatase-like hydrolase/transferase [Arthrobacter sp.]|jgi:arylsulfatase A-like enzyme|nr:sulfatase-like hydrolase/transferase [Arthrobacter sp.]